VTIIFGLLSAFSYGLADFVGALAAKKIRALAVTAISFSFGLVIALLLSQISEASYSAETIQTSIFAGISSAIAISCLYAALALGPISIVSPLTAVISAMIPVIVDVASGQALSGFALFAVALVLVAVVLVGFVPGEKVTLPSLPALIYSLGAGLGFAGIFVFLDATSKDSGLGPLVVMRAVGLSLLILGLSYLAIKNKVSLIEKAAFEVKTLALIFVAGAGDVLGNVAFLIATREGALAIAAVLTSLYPVGTILLAWVILKERIALSQTIGIVMAMAACAILAVG
jgi:drug/metabolite transporter (DMT)-like permease